MKETIEMDDSSGGVHSNLALQAAVAAKKLGLNAVLTLREEDKGNLPMGKILGVDSPGHSPRHLSTKFYLPF